ncbi:hypothetical protein BJ742DRAFT_822584 [Cladochytrium replicatum]|nr:hypothetical protein BJ742DRAFT_822584 [Cladochytrium replicatum]
MPVGGTSRTKSAATIDSDDEGERKDLRVPTGYRPVKFEFAPRSENFEESKMEDPQQQLWLFRIPKNFPISVLNGISFPSSATSLHVAINPKDPSHRAQVIDSSGNIPEGLESFDLHGVSVTALHTPNHDDEHDDAGEVVDMSKMKCIVPSNEKRALKIAPKPFSRFFNLVPHVPLPSDHDLYNAGMEILNQPPVIPKHPGTILEKIVETNPVSAGRKGKRKGTEEIAEKAAGERSETKTKKSKGNSVKVEAEHEAVPVKSKKDKGKKKAV